LEVDFGGFITVEPILHPAIATFFFLFSLFSKVLNQSQNKLGECSQFPLNPGNLNKILF